MQTVLSFWQNNPVCRFYSGAVEPGILPATCRSGVGGCKETDHRCGRAVESCAVPEDRRCKSRPACLASSGEMKGARYQRAAFGQDAAGNQERYSGDVARATRVAGLVFHDADLILPQGKGQDGLDEIAPLRAVGSGGTQDKAVAAVGSNRLLAGKLRGAIDTEGVTGSFSL